MPKKKYVYVQDKDMWIGYWQEFSDYMTQGETLEDLQDHLRDLYQDLTSGEIPCIRHVDELEITGQ